MLKLELLFLAVIAAAKTVTYDFNLTWVITNPDGAYNRPTIGINGQWPIPRIEADVGDRLIINAHNQLGNRSTSLHFHGLYMNGSSHMDGPVGCTQCSVPAGSSISYDFNASITFRIRSMFLANRISQITQPGTYWYHAHADGSYPDGLRGPLIINDPNDPYKGKYDEELVLTLSDWYHDFMPELIARFMSVANPSGAEPVPNSALMNDTRNLQIKIQPGKTYKFRVINIGAFAFQYLWFEGHTMSIIEVDGIYTEPAEASMIYLTPAQRYSFLITTRNDTTENFAIVGSMDKVKFSHALVSSYTKHFQDLFDTVPATLNPNVTGWLVYDEKKSLPVPALIDEFHPFDDFTLVPQDRLKLFDKVDHSIEMNFNMNNLNTGAN